jgi:hypothetical protein
MAPKKQISTRARRLIIAVGVAGIAVATFVSVSVTSQPDQLQQVLQERAAGTDAYQQAQRQAAANQQAAAERERQMLLQQASQPPPRPIHCSSDLVGGYNCN